MSEEQVWFSDAALAKQAALEAKDAAGERIGWTDVIGIWEPRVQPTDAERCRCCGTDARTEVGGNGRYCSTCIGRGHDEDDTPPPPAAAARSAQRASER